MPSTQPSRGRWAPSLAVFLLAVLAPLLAAQPPGFPRPIPPIPQPQMPNFNPPPSPFDNRMETIWTCGKCGKLVSRGEAPPIGQRCPGCGVLFTSASFSGVPTPHAGNEPAPGFTPPNVPIQPPVTPMFPPISQPPVNPNTPLNPAYSSPSTRSNIGTIVLGVLILVAGVGVLGGAACLIVYTIVKKKAPPRRRRRRRFEDDDD